MVKTSPSSARGVSLIPGRGAKIPYGQESQNIKQKQYYNKFNKDFKNDPHQKKKKFKRKGFIEAMMLKARLNVPCHCSSAYLWSPIVNFVYSIIYLFIYNACLPAKWLQLCLSLCEPMNSSPPGSSVHRILQAQILEWVTMPSRPRD